jgi:iron complex outermembrane receptor protein
MKCRTTQCVFRLAIFCLAVGLGQMASAVEADAPPTSSDALEQIVVTAQRRSQNLQDVPIVVQAIPAATIKAFEVTDSTDLQVLTPGLDMHHQSNVLSPSLRGISQVSSSAGDESPIAIYVDGVYYASMNSGLFALNNIQQIEVLKGPQGTLFGRNAAGGVIQIITQKPQQGPYADVSVGYGNYNSYDTNLYATTGITANIATDIAVYWHRQYDGWGRNITTGAETFKNQDLALRNKWLIDFDSATQVTLAADYSRGRDPIGAARSPVPGTRLTDGETHVGGFYDLIENTESANILKQWGGSVRVDHNFDWARFVSISGYRGGQPLTVFDQDAGSTNFVNITASYHSRELTQELQLLSADSSSIKWIVGLFYMNNRTESNLTQSGTSVVLPTTYRATIDTLTTNSVSGFAETTLPLFRDDSHLTMGVRYTADKQAIDGEVFTNLGQLAGSYVSQSKNFDKPTWRVALDHQFTRNLMTYISYNRGFKSGVYNATSPKDAPVDPSVIDAYEAGEKSEWWGGRIRLNGSVYYYHVDGVQLSVPILGATHLLNAAKAEVKGSDLDFEFVPVTHLTLRSGISYTNARYTDFANAPYATPKPTGGYVVAAANGAGNRMVYTPEWTVSAGPLYSIPTDLGTFGLAVNYYYSGGFYGDSPNQFYQPTYQVVNASVDWTNIDGKVNVKVWGKNMNDAQYYNHFSISSQGAVVSPAAPRTYGISFEYKLGKAR